MAKQFLLAGAALVAGISCIAANTPTAEANTRSTVSQQTSVTQFYIDTCSKCHGVRGEGGGGGTQSLLTREKFDQKLDRPFFDAIKNGVPHAGMEGYGSTMSDAQIWGQVVHIRELQAKALRAEFGSPKAVEGVFKSQRQEFRIEEVIDTGLKTPWGIDWLPDGKMLVTNRPGYISVVENGKVHSTVEGSPETRDVGQGGLMEVSVHPNYKQNGWIYLAFTDLKAGKAMTKVVRGKLQLGSNSSKWVEQQTIWESPEEFYTNAGIHFGSRIVFDGKGHVFFVVGERGGNMLAQSLTNPYGKIYRLNDDGSEPADNPFVGKPDVIKGIWSIGHRNPQGMVFDLQGKLWVTEHGPRGGDEVNEIVAGANYGWPVVAFSINYNDAPFRTPWPTPEQNIKLPVMRWIPSIGASGLDVARGSAFANWRGDLLAGGLSGANLDRIRIKDGALVEREELLHGMGRVREVAVGPDGFVYVAFNQPDKIVRLVPAK